MTSPTDIFALLSRWRHLPAYQLERRADVFFAIYLREVIEAEMNLELDPAVIPELPIKRDLIWPETPGNQSVKVDYALFARDRSRAVLVELKTDLGSRRDSQDHYLQVAREVGLQRIIEGIREITLHTTDRQKYVHLLSALANVGCLRLPEQLVEYTYPKPRRGFSRCVRDIEVTIGEGEFEVDVVYIQPRDGDVFEGARVIDFDKFADYVERHDDDMSQAFAQSLREWARAEAGEERPVRRNEDPS